VDELLFIIIGNVTGHSGKIPEIPVRQ